MLQNIFGNIARNGKMHLCAQFGNVITKYAHVKMFCTILFVFHSHTKIQFGTKKIENDFFNKKMLQNLFGDIVRNGKMHLRAQFWNVNI
jgi:hypothetical protein